MQGHWDQPDYWGSARTGGYFMQRRTVISSTGLLAAVLFLPFAAVSAGASSPDDPQPGPTLEVGLTTSEAVVDALVYKPVTVEQNDWLASVASQFEQNDNYTATEISLDRTAIIVTWFGALDPALERLVAAPPADTVVNVEESKYPGGALRAAVADAFANPPEGVQLSSGGVNPDGSGIEVEVVADPGARLDVDALAAELGGKVPVVVTVADPVTPYYGRWNDPYHIGGGFIYNTSTGGGCTSGFATIRGGTQKGMMTAAHCGVVGNVFGRSDSAAFPTGGLWGYGTAALRTTASDGLIIEAPNNHFQSYIWTGTWNTDTTSLLPVSGVATLVSGSELCFSGSYSGLRCGSVVDNPSATWSLGGDLTDISGVRTTSNSDAAGQGDSGGSGVVVVASSSGWSYLAGSIVSGGPGSPSDTCPGKPGTRVCGPVVFSGRASDIAAQTGVAIQITP